MFEEICNGNCLTTCIVPLANIPGASYVPAFLPLKAFITLAFIIGDPSPLLRSVGSAVKLLELATGYRHSVSEGGQGENIGEINRDGLNSLFKHASCSKASIFIPEKKLRHLDILHNIASDPGAWQSRDGDLRSQQRQQAESSTGTGASQVVQVSQDLESGAWVEASAPATPSARAGGLGDLPLFLQHVTLMQELDDLKDKVLGGKQRRVWEMDSLKDNVVLW